MNLQSQTVWLISRSGDSLSAVLDPFLEAGFAVHSVRSPEEALSQIEPADPPALVLLDARDDARVDALRAAAMSMLSHCAFTFLAAVTPIRPEEFHDAMEGLGMLPPLPEKPVRKDGEALLATLRTLLSH